VLLGCEELQAVNVPDSVERTGRKRLLHESDTGNLLPLLLMLPRCLICAQITSA